MNCKIERIVSAEDLVTLRVSGGIDGEHVDTLRESITQEKRGLTIDLTEVILADREAVRLLAVSEANGVELRNCPAYIREWVAREQGARVSDPGKGETI
jgi:anti-anti-sigma regulatory factor